jgi:pyridoxal phosphate enzyme (YggS family)
MEKPLNPDFNTRLESIRKRIKNAAMAAHRDPSEVRLVSVSKTVPIDRVRMAIEGGVTILGENYIQEAREKATALSHLSASWHFLGHLQSNKAKYAVRLFDLIHSVDSLKLAQEIHRQAERIDKIQDILVQVNISGEKTKSGVSADDTLALLTEIASLGHIRVRGLMTLPPFFGEPEKARPFFKSLRELSETISVLDLPNVEMRELSMGMSGDFEAAIAEGATLVRIGTAIFGERV